MSDTEALSTKKLEIEALVDGCLNEYTPEEFQRSAEILKGIKKYRKSVDEFFQEMVDRTYQSWKATTNRRKAFRDPADKAEKALKHKISGYMRWEAQERAREQEEEAARQREAAEKERLAKIEALQDEGAIDEAEHVAATPLDIAPVAKAPETKAEGVSMSYRWHAEVTDLAKLLEFCAKEPRFRYLVLPNAKELNKLAVAQGEMFDIPGVEAKKKPVVSARS